MSAAATTTRTRLTAPALWAAAGLLAVGALAARDPHVHGTWGFCVFRSITGLPCPGCGGLRAVNDLAHGHVGAALASNAWVVLSLAGLVGVVGRVGGRPACGARPRRWPSTPYASRCSGPAASWPSALLRLLPPFAGLQPAP